MLVESCAFSIVEAFSGICSYVGKRTSESGMYMCVLVLCSYFAVCAHCYSRLTLSLCASPEKAQRHQPTCWPHTITFIYSELVGQLAAPSLVPCLRDSFLRVCTSNRTCTELSYCARFVSDLKGCVGVEAEVTLCWHSAVPWTRLRHLRRDATPVLRHKTPANMNWHSTKPQEADAFIW